MGFPLKDWIDDHRTLPHHLARSGMGASLRAARSARAHPLAGDEAALHRELAQHLDVDPRRLFLTHGATEGNASVLGFLRTQALRRRPTPPTFRASVPDYPPLADAARALGYASGRGKVDVAIVSDPNNPTGRSLDPTDWRSATGGAEQIVVDETFREFTERPSRATSRASNVWALGTFTKVYAGDAVRVGWVVVPRTAWRAYGAYHGITTNEIAEASAGAARSLLKRRREILREVRSIVAANRDYLERRVPAADVGEVPLWFDRGTAGFDGDRLAETLVRSGVLVAPGSYFGERSGVRVCLTQRSFPEDLEAYLRVRNRAL